MARNVNGSAGHNAGKQGSGIGGGPVGSSGGYSGRPGKSGSQPGSRPSGNTAPRGTGRPGGQAGRRPGSTPSGSPQQSPNNSGRSFNGGQRGRSSGNGLLITAILALLFGNKNSKRPLGKIIRIAAIVIIVLALLRSCGILGGSYDSGALYGSGSGYDSAYDAAPVATQNPVGTPDPVEKTPAPVEKTPAPTQSAVASTEKPSASAEQSSASSSSAGSTASGPSTHSASGSSLSAHSSSSTGTFSGNSHYSSTSSAGTAYGSTGAASSYDLNSVYGGHSSLSGSSYSSNGWADGSNCGKLNTSVAEGSRAKFTSLNGNGNDTATVMIYMCGTDLESKYGMATKDLQEIANATIADNVNIIVYAGGCTGWRNSLMSSSTNQIYKVESGGSFLCLNENAGNKSMVAPSTLSGFIQYCSTNYPADRNMLIFWDHGGGSLSGYGYDQKFQSAGSMTLDGIDEALENGGVKFDFIGFDACLMATVETAEVCSRYADYLIASEESEPGYGWYYTNWVTMLSKNTSVSTLELGKQIVDDFVDVSAKQCAGQDTTLSLTDLAEFSATVPEALNNWADSTAELILSDYKTVSSARSGSKEFAADSRIDQVDLTHVAVSLNTDAGRALADVVLSAVKYNRTSSSVKNAYGLSIYFPYRGSSSYLNKAVSTYSELDFDDSYTKCIQTYAQYAQSGQTASYSSGYSSALGSLLESLTGGSYSTGSSGSGYGNSYNSGSYGSDYGSGYSNGYGSQSSSYGYGSGYGSSYGSGYGGSSYGASSYSSDDLYSMIYSMLGGRSLTGGSAEKTARNITDYVSANTFDASALVWQRGSDGKLKLSLPEQQWNLLNEVKLNLFLDDGEGFIDYGLDLYSGYFDESGALIGEFDNVWLTIDDWTVAYYQMYTVVEESGTVVTSGRVPCLYNGERANLLIEIVDDVPAVVGVCYDYLNGNHETDTKAKSITEFNAADTVTFVADYYDYDNNYQNSYAISDELTLGDGLTAEYKYISGSCTPNACYRLTDLYSQDYWTPVLENAETETGAAEAA